MIGRDRLGSVCWLGLILGVLGDTLVPDVSNVAGVGVSSIVGDNLGATVGKGHAVLTKGGVSIPLLILAKVGARVAVRDSILVSIDGGGVSWGGVRGWGAGSVGSSSQEKGSDESLGVIIKKVSNVNKSCQNSKLSSELMFCNYVLLRLTLQ